MSQVMETQERINHFPPMQQTELWVNNCSTQSMCITKIHFQHLWHRNIGLKRLLTVMWISSTVVACRDLWSNQVVASIRAALILQPSEHHRRRRQAGFLENVFRYVSSGQFGRILSDSIRLTDVNLIQQAPKRWLLFMTPWSYLHNMLLIMPAAFPRSDCLAVFVSFFFFLPFFSNSANIWWDRGGREMCQAVTKDMIFCMRAAGLMKKKRILSDVKVFVFFLNILICFWSVNLLLRIVQ